MLSASVSIHILSYRCLSSQFCAFVVELSSIIVLDEISLTTVDETWMEILSLNLPEDLYLIVHMLDVLV